MMATDEEYMADRGTQAQVLAHYCRVAGCGIGARQHATTQ